MQKPELPEGHALSGHDIFTPHDMAGTIVERKAFFDQEFNPDSPFEHWLSQWICILSVQLDRSLQQIIAYRAERSRQAGESWNDDRCLRAVEIGQNLSKQPELTVQRLIQFKQGVEWLLRRWEHLATLLKADEWSPGAHSQLLDLQGVAHEMRTQRQPSPPTLESLNNEIAALNQRLNDYLNDRDDRERADTILGLNTKNDKDLQHIQREMATHQRDLKWFRTQLRKSPARSQASSPHPRPTATDATEPAIRRVQPSPPPARPESDHIPNGSVPGMSPLPVPRA